MTFSQSVKSEIIKSVRNAKPCCAKSFLTAVLKAVGSMTLIKGGYCFSVESDNAEFLTLIGRLAEGLGHTTAVNSYNISAKGTAVYSCQLDAALGEELGLTVRDADGALAIADAGTLLPSQPCCRKAFMQGLFVSAGSVVAPQMKDAADPDDAKYHLELRFANAELAAVVQEGYPAAGFHRMPRKNHIVLYLKDGDRISDFLVYVSATGAMMDLENVRIMRSMRNDVNRQNNCALANIEKTVAASSGQTNAIRQLRSSGLWDNLPEGLRQIALIREAHPEYTLEEIAAETHLSKSGVKHRFDKLMQLADQQRKHQ